LDLPGSYPTLMRGAANPANPSSLFRSSQREDDDNDDDTHHATCHLLTTKNPDGKHSNHFNKIAQRNPKTQSTENLHLNTHNVATLNIPHVILFVIIRGFTCRNVLSAMDAAMFFMKARNSDLQTKFFISMMENALNAARSCLFYPLTSK